jgi:hypothetical protein
MTDEEPILGDWGGGETGVKMALPEKLLLVVEYLAFLIAGSTFFLSPEPSIDSMDIVDDLFRCIGGEQLLVRSFSIAFKSDSSPKDW